LRNIRLWTRRNGERAPLSNPEMSLTPSDRQAYNIVNSFSLFPFNKQDPDPMTRNNALNFVTFCIERLIRHYIDYDIKNVELGLGSGSAKTVQIRILIHNTALICSLDLFTSLFR
jgi:hypothetical protein